MRARRRVEVAARRVPVDTMEFLILFVIIVVVGLALIWRARGRRRERMDAPEPR